MNNTSLTRWLILIATGALLSGAISAFVSTRYFPLSIEKLDFTRGRELFERKCAGCHASDLDGADKFGPGLHDIGHVAATRKSAMNAVDYILESILYPSVFRAEGVEGHMPANVVEGVSDNDLRDLVAYLANLGSTPDYASLINLDTSTRPADENVSYGSITSRMRGWELFSKQLGCNSCHSIQNIPGSNLVAPSLHLASQYSVDYLRNSIVNPNDAIAPGYQQVTLTMIKGEVYSGRLIDESKDNLVLLERNLTGKYARKVFSIEELATIIRSEVSPMPAYELSSEDEFALLAFLKFLQGG